MASPYSVDSISILLKDNVELKLFAESPIEQESLLSISEDKATANGEECYQLLEGFTYEYYLPCGFSIQEDQGIVKASRVEKNHGRIIPNIYVGRLLLAILKDGDNFDAVAIEIRSL